MIFADKQHYFPRVLNDVAHYSRSHQLVFLLFLFVCAGYYSMPLWDGDFWWHIAAGREILATGEIPSQDPFGVYPATDKIRNDTMLRSEWLGEVLLYALFNSGGENAVIAFRVITLLVCIALIYLRCRWLSVGSFAMWTVFILAAPVAFYFGGERPQLLSFLFASLFFVVIDRAEQKADWRRLLLLPLITVIWANCHGGVLLGVALLGLWSGIKWLSTDNYRHEKWIWSAMAGAVFLASITTPNNIQTYLYLYDLENSVLQSRTSEYASIFKLHTLVGFSSLQIWIYAFYAAAIAAAIMLVRLKNILPATMIIVLGLFSASAFRYFIFFLIISAPYVALGLQRLLPAGVLSGIPVKRIGYPVLAVVLGVIFSAGIYQGKVFRGGFDQSSYPVAIADFISKQGLQGRAFNNLEWGGYLLWRLSPQVRMYIDGRMLDGSRLLPYTHILWATKPGIVWFERENFQLVILPYHGRFDPEQYKLIQYLEIHKDWQQIYRDIQGVVFVKQ